MPEEGLETHELKEQLEEAAEHAHGHGHGKGAPGWITALSLSTAVIAVLAAIASLYSGARANEAILLKNDAIHKTAEAADRWTYYQAKGIKEDVNRAMQSLVVLMTPSGEGADTKKFELAKQGFEKEEKNALAKKNASEAEARGFEAEREQFDEESEQALQHHELFAKAVTIFQVSIAIAAIAALTKKKFMWFASMLAGAGGVVFLVLGFLPSKAKAAEHAAEHPSAEVAPAAEHGSAKPPAEGHGGEKPAGH
jgi:hypothetical protein